MSITPELTKLVEKLVKERWSSLGPIFTPGRVDGVGNAKLVTPGLITLEFAEPGLLPIAITSRCLVRKVLGADVANIDNVHTSLGLTVPVLAGERWIVNARVYADSAATKVGGYMLSWLALPANSFFRFAVLGVGTSASTMRRAGSNAAGALGTFGVFDTSGFPYSLYSDATLVITVTADGNLDLSLAAAVAGDLHTVRAGSYVVAHRVS